MLFDRLHDCTHVLDVRPGVAQRRLDILVAEHALCGLQVAVLTQGPDADAGAVSQIVESEILDVGFPQGPGSLLAPAIMRGGVPLSLSLERFGAGIHTDFGRRHR